MATSNAIAAPPAMIATFPVAIGAPPVLRVEELNDEGVDAWLVVVIILMVP